MGNSHIKLSDWFYGVDSGSSIPIPAAIYSYWKLDEVSGDAIDSLGNKNLTEVGTVSAGLTGIFGNYRYGFAPTTYLEGLNTQADTKYLSGGNHTYVIEAFVQADTVTSRYYQAIYQTTEKAHYLRFDGDIATNVASAQYVDGTIVSSTAADMHSAWHHIMEAKIGQGVADTNRLYVDGVLVDAAVGNASTVSADGNIHIGIQKYYGSLRYQAMNLKICDVAWWTDLTLDNVPGTGTLAERIDAIAAQRWNDGAGQQYTV